MTTPAPERVDNPPPFKAKLGSYGRAPWHRDDDPVSGWEPEFRALAAALDYNRADGEWGIAFAHLRAGARRNLALCRAEQYRDFLEVLDDIHAGDFTAEERDVFLSSFRNRMATSETDQVPRIIDVTLRRLPVADKQRHGDPTRRKELMDPPTRAETLAALRLLRGVWIHAPASCAAAGDAGATEALTRCLAVGVPPSPRDSPADLLARALEQWKREGGWKASTEAAEAAEGEVEGGGSARGAAPPVKIAFPEGRGEDGESPRVMSIGWEVDDPESAFGQPEEDEIRSEVLEALLALLSGDERCREAFVEGGGVQTAASYLVPWLAEGGGEEAPSELVQRCIVFLGVLVRHVLPKSESRWTPGARGRARRTFARGGGRGDAGGHHRRGGDARDSSRRGGARPGERRRGRRRRAGRGMVRGRGGGGRRRGRGRRRRRGASRRVDARAEGERRGVERRDARDDGGGSRGDGAANGRGG